MKRFNFAMCAVALLTLCAFSEQVVVPLTITANGVVASDGEVAGINASVTNFAFLNAVYVTVPAQTYGAVALQSHDGNGAVLTLDGVTYANTTSNAVAKLWMPRKGVWNSANPTAESYPLVGTNAFLTVTQTVATTNDWKFTIAVER